VIRDGGHRCAFPLLHNRHLVGLQILPSSYILNLFPVQCWLPFSYIHLLSGGLLWSFLSGLPVLKAHHHLEPCYKF
jgi:hypothetical protein